MQPQIAILDFGSQYTHLITRRIRQLGVLAEIYPPTIDINELEDIKGIILSGGPISVYDDNAIQYNPDVFDTNLPILGICYGLQLMSHHLGGSVISSPIREYGLATLLKQLDNPLFKNLEQEETIWMSHGDKVNELPPGFEAIGSTKDCPVAAMQNLETKRFGLQFHPEVTHSINGIKIIKNFLFDICKCEKNWTTQKYWEQTQEKVKQKVGDKNVFLFVSGGIDSTVCYAMLEKILGPDRVLGVHIDHGLLRLDESKKVKESLNSAGFASLKVIDASKDFLSQLEGVTEPEEKRKIIGRLFVETRSKVMKDLQLDPDQWMLGQGTIYPDIIESGGTKHADTIKTHHNRVPEIMELIKQGSLIEPIAAFYKDEVREIGRLLGIPEPLVEQHPFPGPGLAIRTLCSPGPEPIENEDQINKQLNILIPDEYQAFVLPIKSVGVQGDNRTYKHPALIIGDLDWNKLNKLSVEITNQIPEVNRVLTLISPDKITIDSLSTRESYLTPERLDILRRADHLINNELQKSSELNKIWQFPIVLAPMGTQGGETIILRPIESTEAMTASFYHLPHDLLNAIKKKVESIKGIDVILFDITNKPPGTIEWE